MNSQINIANMKKLMEYGKSKHINRQFDEAIEVYKNALIIGKKLYQSNISDSDKELLTDDLNFIMENIKKCKDDNFDKLIGVEDFKKLFRENIFSVVRYKKLAEEFYKLKSNWSILLVGKPGTGKSFAVRTAVNEFPEAKLFLTKTTELIDPLVGKTGQNIDALFNKVREYLKKHKDRYAVVFIDEIDGIAKSRKFDDKASQSAMSSLLVNLTQVDVENLNIVFIGATNTPDHLDAAFKSRFGNNIIEVPLPDGEARVKMLQKNITQYSNDIDWEKIKVQTDGLSCRDLKNIANDATNITFNKTIAYIKKNNINEEEAHKYALPVNEDTLIEVIQLAIKRREEKGEFI